MQTIPVDGLTFDITAEMPGWRALPRQARDAAYAATVDAICGWLRQDWVHPDWKKSKLKRLRALRKAVRRGRATQVIAKARALSPGVFDAVPF